MSIEIKQEEMQRKTIKSRMLENKCQFWRSPLSEVACHGKIYSDKTKQKLTVLVNLNASIPMYPEQLLSFKNYILFGV